MSDTYFSPLWYRLASLRPRLKAHAEFSLHSYGGEAWYLLRDAVTGKIHRFSAAAYGIIGAMDGRATLDQIWRAATQRAGAEAPSQDDVVQLTSQLYQADLLSVDGVPDAAEVLERMRRQRAQKTKRYFFNPLSITIPLFNPDRLLTALAPLVRGSIFWLWAALWSVLVLSALPLVPTFGAALTKMGVREIFALQNLVLIACVYPAIKTVHEFAHGLAMKRHGGQALEMGVMLLVFYPVPYIDASQSAFFPSKYARALVGAAGILAEIGLAALALHLWVLMEPGLWRDLAFNVMLIGGVSTIAVNGNPLLRFDGYYVLCDLAEVPNLASRANQWWGDLVKTRLLGVPRGRPRRTRPLERVLYFFYAPLAYAYRLVIMLTISAAVATRFFILGVVLAAWSVTLGFLLPTAKTLAKVWTDPQIAERQSKALAFLLLGATLLLIGVFMVPLPLRETTQGVVWLPEQAQIRAATAGTITAIPAAQGTEVSREAPLVVMQNEDLLTRIAVQAARVSEARAAALAERAKSEAAYLLAAAQLSEEEKRLAALTDERDKLDIRAGQAGRIDFTDPDALLGRYVPEGELLGYVLPPGGTLVRAVLPQAQAELIQSRYRGVTVLPAGAPDDLPAELLRQVPAAINALPSAALGPGGGGPFLVRTEEGGGTQAIDRLIQLELAVPGLGAQRFGQRVFVKLDYGNEPLGYRVLRAIRLTFLRLFAGA